MRYCRERKARSWFPSVSFSAWTVPLREGSQNESRPNDYVAQITDAFDVHDGLVA